MIVSFEDYRPPARFDSIPWANAQIEEATTPGGTWVLIDTIALAPLDPDPANPASRDFTTSNATNTEGLWYRVIFDDGLGGESLPTTPVQNVTDAVASGTCQQWIGGADVALCCQVDGSSDTSIFDSAADQATELLFELSGRRFNGACVQTVRPCRTTCACGWQVLSRGHIVWNPNFDWGFGLWGGWSCNGDSCGCAPLSKVPLAGYVQDIIEVVIDGVAVDPDTYRVDRHRWLVRQRLSADDATTPAWPGCQSLDLPLGEPGTWSVEYTYGVPVPAAGEAAAIELACEIYKACADADNCRLPAGTQRVARLGVTIEKVPFTQWGWTSGKRAGQVKGWNTGLAAVDAFLNAYNPSGLLRVPVIWSPNAALEFPVVSN